MTENHSYNTPEKGSTDWNVPVNNNFERLDRDVEVRDVESQLNNYAPKNGAKFFATDTGAVYVGNGSEWTEVPFRLSRKTTDPSDPAVGQVWYRADVDNVKVQTADGPKALQFASSSSESDGDSSIRTYDSISFDDTAYTDTFTNVDDWNDQNRSITSQTHQGTTLDRTALEIATDEGNHWGSILRYAFGDTGHPEPEELYARYYLYFPSDFEVIEGGGKLPGPAGAYGDDAQAGNPSDGTNGWSARGAFRPANTSDSSTSVPILPEYYVYHADMSGSYGDRWAWDTTFDRGRWYQIDQHIKMNTPGQNDGVLGAWVDGQQVFDKRDLSFRNEGYNNIKIEMYWFTYTYGGSWTSPRDNAAYFSDFTLAQDPLL